MVDTQYVPPNTPHNTRPPSPQPEQISAASFQSVPDMWHHRCQSTPGATAMIYREHGPASQGEWTSMTWRRAEERAREIANGLLAQGLPSEGRCCIVSRTRVEWILADMGILCAGGATTTIYPSSTPDECEYIVRDCDASLVFCDTEAQVDKLLSVRARIPGVKKVVVFDGAASDDGWVVTLAQFRKIGRDYARENPNAYGTAHSAVTPHSLATLIYTSGTTGEPKGVMLDHDAWIYEAEAIDALGIISPADKQYLTLPLSHVFAKVMQVIFIRLGVPTVVDGDMDALVANVGQTSPTWMGAVPRVFEKAYNGIVMDARAAGGVRARVFFWALDVGRQVSRLRQSGREPSGLLKWKFSLADRVVFSKVRATFGDKLRFFISGGAPLSVEIAEFFHACGILILEGYGLTESAAASTLNRPGNCLFGTVGEPIPGCRVRVADDGELLLHSRGVMTGYHRQPEETAAVLFTDDDGRRWLRTGDIGVVLTGGHVKITDRKKEIIVTASGKNIAPAHFQNLLKDACPYVSEVLMHGDKRPYCVALISLNRDLAGAWAAKQGVEANGYADLATRPEVKALIWQAVQDLNATLPTYETVKKIALLPEDMTQETGLMTPSLKVKRRVVEARYQEILDAFYEGSVQKMD